jgi:tRNA-dihydrouridine synthase B
MEGLTSRPFRAVLEQQGGLGAVYTEFIGEVAAISAKVARRTVERGRAPLVVQLLGKDPAKLGDATRRMVDAGADGVDLNVGCPSSCVTHGLRGAALLRDPILLGRLLDAMVEAAGGRVPVSAKVRAGWQDPRELLPIARLVESAGVDFLVVHGRTFAEAYRGEARLELCAQARAAVSIPVVANGDIVRASQAAALLASGAVDGVMIGRGAVRNPWIFAQLDALRRGEEPPRPGARDLGELLRRFAAAFAEAFGRERAALAKLKELAALLAPAIADGGRFTGALRRAQSLDEALATIPALLEPLPDEQLALAP